MAIRTSELLQATFTVLVVVLLIGTHALPPDFFRSGYVTQ